MKKIISFFLLAVFFNISQLSAENLLKDNTSFEVGRWGYDAMPCVFLRNWNNFKYPQGTDETSADGQYSLKLSNPTGMDAINVYFPAFEIKEKTKIVGSFYAKSDVDGVKIIADFVCGSKYIISRTLVLSTEWKRYAVDGDLGVDFLKESQQSGRKGFYAFRLTVVSGSTPVFKNIWVDAVQVEKDNLTDYKPAKVLDAAIDMTQYEKKRHLVYSVGEKETAELKIYSATDILKPYKVEYSIKDMISDKIISKNILSGNLDKNGSGKKIIQLPKIERRLYKIEAFVSVDKNIAKAERIYGGIKDLSNVKMNNKFLGGSIETTVARLFYLTTYLSHKDPTYKMATFRLNPETYITLAKSIGWQWIHMYSQLYVNLNQYEKGKYYWEDTDYYVDILLKNNLEIMSNLSSSGGLDQYSLPKWMLTGKPGEGGSSQGKGSPLPDAKEYENFCYEASKRYTGKIDIWESWNEPGVKMRAYEYMPLLEACYNGVKRGNPNAKVLGLTSTGDLKSDLYGWTKTCTELGADKYMDAIAIHGYVPKDIDYSLRAKNIVKSITGKDFDVWNTESSVEVSDPYGNQAYYSNGATQNFKTSLIALSQHFVNGLVFGVKRLSWFNLDTTYNWLGKSERSLIYYDGSPDAGLIGCNFIIELFDKAKFYKSVKVEGNTIAYVFERTNGPFLVYWNEIMNTEGNIKLDKGTFEVLDMLGGNIDVKSENNTIVLPVNKDTHYLMCKGISAEELVNAASKIQIKGLNPIKVIRTHLSVVNDKPVIIAEISNQSSRAQEITIFTMQKPAWMTNFIKEKFTLAPMTNKEFNWDISTNDNIDNNNIFKLSIETLKDTTVVEIPLKIMESKYAKVSPVIDGDGNDEMWKAIQPYILDKWVNVSTSYNEKGIYFLFDVKDNEIANYKDFTDIAVPVWKTDGIELFFDWDREADINNPVFNEDDTQLMFAVKGNSVLSKDEINKGPDEYSGNKNFSIDKANMESKKTEYGYSAEIEIPWSCLDALKLTKKAILGFSISVRDIGKTSAERKRVIWSGIDDNYRDTSGFGLLIFEK